MIILSLILAGLVGCSAVCHCTPNHHMLGARQPALMEHDEFLGACAEACQR